MTAAKFLLQSPVLLASDLLGSIQYWNEKLGFQNRSIVGEPPHFGILARDNCFVMLKQSPPEHVIVPNWKVANGIWNAYFWVDDARSLFAEMKSRGANIDYELCDQPYGVLEFGIQDLDEHDIGFGQELKPSLAHDSAR